MSSIERVLEYCMKMFTLKSNAKGKISNRLYIKLRILKGSDIAVFFSLEAFDLPDDRRWVVPSYCANKGYQAP